MKETILNIIKDSENSIPYSLLLRHIKDKYKKENTNGEITMLLFELKNDAKIIWDNDENVLCSDSVIRLA
ncbi:MULTISPECIES: hypothetical protein [Providencia]|uniref:hypothetical protein n=1 Tax=Providencia TaxID=586 RepID=UPI00234AEAFD|nr:MULTISPECIES: hypothetical protein [unclassified Providencia]